MHQEDANGLHIDIHSTYVFNGYVGPSTICTWMVVHTYTSTFTAASAFLLTQPLSASNTGTSPFIWNPYHRPHTLRSHVPKGRGACESLGHPNDASEVPPTAFAVSTATTTGSPSGDVMVVRWRRSCIGRGSVSIPRPTPVSFFRIHLLSNKTFLSS